MVVVGPFFYDKSLPNMALHSTNAYEVLNAILSENLFSIGVVEPGKTVDADGIVAGPVVVVVVTGCLVTLWKQSHDYHQTG